MQWHSDISIKDTVIYNSRFHKYAMSEDGMWNGSAPLTSSSVGLFRRLHNELSRLYSIIKITTYETDEIKRCNAHRGHWGNHTMMQLQFPDDDIGQIGVYKKTGAWHLYTADTPPIFLVQRNQPILSLKDLNSEPNRINCYKCSKPLKVIPGITISLLKYCPVCEG